MTTARALLLGTVLLGALACREAAPGSMRINVVEGGPAIPLDGREVVLRVEWIGTPPSKSLEVHTSGGTLADGATFIWPAPPVVRIPVGCKEATPPCGSSVIVGVRSGTESVTLSVPVEAGGRSPRDEWTKEALRKVVGQ